MLFNSFQFLIFFPVVTFLYFWLPHRYRWILLLIASSVFYMAFIPAYIFVLIFLIVVDYFAGILIDKHSGRKRKLLLLASILSNGGALFIFKYFNFINANIALVYNWLGMAYPIGNLGILLPVGLSFHTFQSLSYTIEVYRGNYKPERHFGFLALYVMFYPQLVAGPIERPQNLLRQLHERYAFDYQRVANGLKLMLWGFFKKVVVADRLGLVVDAVYNQPTSYRGPTLIMATVFFAFQIYGDFSGYTDIARGAAKVMGINLVQNFALPYGARSIADFWRRWHMSLSSWFRDYVYIPLGGSRFGYRRWLYALLVTFLISGLWHGAQWAFAVWGLLHGLYIIIESSLASLSGRASVFFRSIPRFFGKGLAVAATFILVCFAWIFFRASTLSDAWYIVRHLADFNPFSLLDRQILKSYLLVGQTGQELRIALAVIAFLVLAEWLNGKYSLISIMAKAPLAVRLALYSAFVWLIIIYGVFAERQFIYFVF